MATKFRKIYMHQLRNDAHFQLHTEFKDQLGKTAAATEVTQIATIERYIKLLNARRGKGSKGGEAEGELADEGSKINTFGLDKIF
jgi:hypothetical protein